LVCLLRQRGLTGWLFQAPSEHFVPSWPPVFNILFTTYPQFIPCAQ